GPVQVEQHDRPHGHGRDRDDVHRHGRNQGERTAEKFAEAANGQRRADGQHGRHQEQHQSDRDQGDSTSEAVRGQGLAGIDGQGSGDVRGVAGHAAQGVGGERALELQPDVGEPEVCGGQAFDLEGQAVAVERAEGAQVVQAGPVAGGEDDGVDGLAGAVGPDDVLAVEGGEHRPPVEPSGLQGGGVVAGVQDEGAGGQAGQPVRRQVVEAGGGVPVVDVLAADDLRHELERLPGGEGDGGDLGEFVADLDGGVAGADDDDALSGELLGVAVRGHMQRLPGEVSGQVGDVRVAEGATRRDDTPGVQGLACRGVNEEPAGAVGFDRGDPDAGADLDVEGVGVALQVGDGLVAGGVVVGIAREVQSGHGAVAGGREEGEAVVVAGPGAGGPLACFEDDGSE